MNANYATSHQWLAKSLVFQGRFDEALKESERAHELDPLSVTIATDKVDPFYDPLRGDPRFQEMLRDAGFNHTLLHTAIKPPSPPLPIDLPVDRF